MAVLEADFVTDLTPAEGGDMLWSLPIVAPAREPLDWASLLEEAEARVKEERGRAAVAELRREELRRSESDARALADSLTRQLDTCRFKLKTATSKTASRAAKGLERRVESQDDEIADLRLTLRRSHERQERIEKRHQDEINWLKQDIDRERSRIAKVYREGERVAGSLRKQFDRQLAAARRRVEAREGTIAWLRERNARMRAAIVRATELIASLREKNARLRAEVRDLKGENAALASQVETLQARLDKLRSTRSVLSKALYGSRSEQQKRPGTGRKRGQQRGAAGHGRTQRPGLGQKKEPRDPPEEARVCPRCGKPYAANGERCTTLFEIDVEAYENTIVRSRWRRSCDCASAPREVTAPPVTRLFETTPYGISVWTCMLYERFVCCRPLHRVAAWLADMGLAISPGDPGRQHQALRAAVRTVGRGDPRATRTRPRCATPTKHPGAFRRIARKAGRAAPGCGSRSATMPSTSTSTPSRSAEVAMKLFGSVKDTVVLVCDRFQRLQEAGSRTRRQGDPAMVLGASKALVHRPCRRSCAAQALVPEMDRADRADLPAERCAAGALRPRSPSRTTVAGVRRRARQAEEGGRRAVRSRRSGTGRTDGQGAQGQNRCARFSTTARGCASSSTKPFVPMDNNRGELSLRFAGHRATALVRAPTARKVPGSRATMYSVAGTLAINGIDVRRWLREWLTACAENGGKPPDDLSPWLPWSMSEERRRELTASGWTGAVECRYHGRDFTAEEMALLRALIACPRIALPPRPVDRVLPSHRLAQARRRGSRT